MVAPMQGLGAYLKAELKRRQERNPCFSLRSFAKWLNISPAQLSQMMSGKRTVTGKTLGKVSERLGLSPVERLQFMQASFPDFVENGAAESIALSEDQFRLISDWYHLAILSLTELRRPSPTRAGWANDWAFQRAKRRRRLTDLAA